jgi:hypothetical protein
MLLRKALLNTTMLAGILGGTFLSVNRASAADLRALPQYPQLSEQPAVDGFNTKFSGLGGTLAHRSLYGSEGSASIPLANRWGLQFDGSVGALDGRTFGSFGPHLFWRDPSQGLIGLYASHTRWNQFGDVYVTQVGGEGEAYLGRFTLQSIAGVEFGNSVSSLAAGTSIVPPAGGALSPPGVATTSTFIQGFDVGTRFFDQVNLKYYWTDNWSGYAGHRYLGGKNALALGTEVAWPLGNGLMGSGFVEARIGQDPFQGVWGGLRFYFGRNDKTLLRRQREDDPLTWDTLFSILNNSKSSSSLISTLFCTPPRTLQLNGKCEIGIPSDIRLKRDIVLIKRTENGLGLYRYRYLWSEEFYVGVMAQEVAEIRPDAVMRGIDGFLRVNYDKLGLKFMKFEEWIVAAVHSTRPRSAASASVSV